MAAVGRVHVSRLRSFLYFLSAIVTICVILSRVLFPATLVNKIVISEISVCEWKCSERLYFIPGVTAARDLQLQLSSTPSRRTKTVSNSARPRGTPRDFHFLIVLLLSGDIHLNPGPVPSRSLPFTLYYQNVQSLKNKLSHCERHLCELLQYDCIALSETWLNDKVFDSEIPLHSNFVLYRRDRGVNIRGGGTLLAVHQKYKSRRREDLESENCELIWAEISIPGTKLLVGCYYRPPNGELASLEACFESVGAALQYGNVILVGDFNLSIKWSSESSGIPTNFMDKWFLQHFIDGLQLKQPNLSPTRKKSTLDYVLTTYDGTTTNTGLNLLTSDHDSIDAHITIDTSKSKNNHLRQPIRRIPLWKKTNWEDMNITLSLLPWDVLSSLSIDEAVSTFYDWCHAAISDLVPFKTLKSQKYPHWISQATKLLLYNKNRAWKLWKQFPNPHTENSFKTLRRQCKSSLKTEYSAHVNNITSNAKSNPKRFWTLVKSRRNSPSVPTHITMDNKAASGCDRAQLFNQYFSQSFLPPTTHQTKLPPVTSVCHSSLNLIRTSESEVKSLIDGLPTSRATGPDNIGTIFLKNTSRTLSKHITFLLNTCFSVGQFPLIWKQANITPIFKSGNKSSVTSYRPISILPILSLIAEKIIHNRLLTYTLPFLNSTQHGFLPNSSCLTNLAVLQSEAVTAIEENSQLDTVYLDFQKAFDSINHVLLIHKLSSRFGIAGPLLKLLESFLKERQQRVVLPGSISEWSPVASGVPQGSVLGPVLFTLYVDDMADILDTGDNSKLLLFADDTKLFRQINSAQDTVALQQDLDRVVQWCDQWLLKLNPEKCVVMSYSLKLSQIPPNYIISGKSVKRLSEHKDLGILMDNKLIFSSHIDFITSRAMKLLGLLYRFTEITDVHALTTYFRSVVIPSFSYSTPIWNMAAKTNLTKVTRIYNFFCAIVKYRVPSLSHLQNPDLLHHLGIRDFSCSTQLNDLKFLYEIINGKPRCTYLLPKISLRVPSRKTRHTQLLFTPRPRTCTAQRSLFYRLPNSLNAINNPSIDPFLPKERFISALKVHLNS